MKYSTETFDSKLLPGVKYTLKRMSHGRRIQLNQALASFKTEFEGFRSEAASLWQVVADAEDVAKIEPCSCKHEVKEDTHSETTKRCMIKGCDCRKPDVDPTVEKRFLEILNKMQDVEFNQIIPAYIKWGVKTVEGLEIDDQQVSTPEQLLDLAPEPLVNEIYRELKRLTELSSEEQLAFGSPSTGTGQASAVAGENQSTTADTAKK